MNLCSNFTDTLDLASGIDIYCTYIISLANQNKENIDLNYNIFLSHRNENIGISKYCRILALKCNLSPSCFVYASCILDKCIEKDNLVVNKNNIHKLCLTFVLLSAKMLEDVIYDNSYWALIGGVTLKKINMYEKFILHILDFSIHFSLKEYNAKFNKLRIIYLKKKNCYFY